jgi:hypothetical protein
MKKLIIWLWAFLLLSLFVTQTMAGSWTLNEFLYKPALGARGAGEKDTYDSGLDRVDARLGKQIWVGDPKYGSTIQSSVAAIGSTPTTLRIPPGTWNILENLTIPANINLKVEQGAILSLGEGVTLTINGPLEAGSYQIFSCTGSGKAVFSARTMRDALPQWWGATGAGIATHDDTAAIQAALNSGAPRVVFNGGTYGVSASLTINADTELAFSQGASFESNLEATEQPWQYFLVSGNNVTIDGLTFALANETKVGDNGTGNCICLDDGVANFTLKNSDLRYFFSCVTAWGTYDTVRIENCTFVGVYVDLWLAWSGVYGSHVRILNNQFIVHRNWNLPFVNKGVIYLAGGLSDDDLDTKPTDTIYETQCISDVEIRGNYIYKCDGRPIRLTNCSQITIADNHLEQVVGHHYNEVGVPNDLIALDLCRNFTITGNVTYGGGENALDLMACVNGTVTGNTFRAVNNAAVCLATSEWYIIYPDITLSKKYLKNEHITISGNSFEAFSPFISWMGSHFNFTNNTLKIFTGSSYCATSYPYYLAFGTVDPIPALWSTNPELRPGNIRVSGNKIDLGPKYLVTANAETDQFATSVAHDFVTGESVELLVGGNVLTVDLPTGVYSTTWLKTGTHNGGNASATLIDTTTNFVTQNVVKGMWVVNVTDGSQGRITNISTTSNPNDTITAALSGGTDNKWDNGDTYQFRLPYFGVSGYSGTMPTATPYWVIKVDDTHLKLATSFANASAGNAIDILDAGGGSGQELYLRRLPYRRVINDGNYMTYAEFETIELEPELAHQEIRLFNGYTGDAATANCGFRKNVDFEYILDPGLSYGPGGGNNYKSRLPKYVKMPPFFYHAGDTKSYGLGVSFNNKYSTLVYLGDRIIKYLGAPTADTCGFIRIKWY